MLLILHPLPAITCLCGRLGCMKVPSGQMTMPPSRSHRSASATEGKDLCSAPCDRGWTTTEGKDLCSAPCVRGRRLTLAALYTFGGWIHAEPHEEQIRMALHTFGVYDRAAWPAAPLPLDQNHWLAAWLGTAPKTLT